MNEDSKETLRKEFIIHEANKIPNLSTFLCNTGDAITAIATTGFVGISKDLISLMKNVKIIASNGVGYDSIDANFCANRNIIVTHTPNVLNAEVANTTLMMFLASFRQFRFNEEYLRNGQWKKKGTSMYTHAIPISMPQCTVDILVQIRKWDQEFQYLAQATAGFHFKRNKPIQNRTVSFSRPGLT